MNRSVGRAQKWIYNLHCTKPGHLSEGKISSFKGSDPQKTIDACLACKAPKCYGDCKGRRTGRFEDIPLEKWRDGLKKGVNPDEVERRWDSGMGINEIAKDMGISHTCVRYWLKKLGRV